MVAKWIEKLGQFNFDFKHRAGKKIQHADCLSRIKTEDKEQTAFVNSIALDVEQDDTDYSSRGWRLHKLQRVQLRDSQQSDNILEEVYSWVINKKRPEPRQMRNGASKELWKYWVQYKNFCLYKGFCIENTKQNLTLKLFTKSWYPVVECPTFLSCCMVRLAQDTLV